MPSNDQIPTLANLRPKRKLRSPEPQEAFDFTTPKPYQPIVLTETKSEPTLYTVRQLIAALRQTVESTYLTSIHVEGEISNCRPAASGHLYFTLKDGDAQLPAVLFRRQAQLLPFKPKDGMQVEARGRVSVYESRGQLQLIAETLKPRGEGALELAFQQLKRKLKLEGLFDRPKRPLPPFPHCLGIVTSASGAALRDIIHVIRRRHARLNLLIYPATMQGPNCAPSVIRALRWFNEAATIRVPQVSNLRPGADHSNFVPNPVPHSSQSHRDEWVPTPQIPCVDLILIARGGGSLEDLAGFNDERLARAIAASRLPIITGIGHETDTTIADYVADLRAPTPSAAAELVTAAQHRIEDRVLSLEKRTHRAGQYHLLRARQRFSRLSADQVLARLRDAISLRQQRIDDLTRRLEAAVLAGQARRLRNRTQRIAALETRLRRHDPAVRLADSKRRLLTAADRLARLATTLITRRTTPLTRATDRLQSLSPLAVLNRGYAIVYTQKEGEPNTILRTTTDTKPGQQIQARLAQGTLTALVVASD